MALQKLEGRITIASGTQLRITENGGSNIDVTITAGDYYLIQLLSQIGTDITAHASTVGTYTVTLDDTSDTATGKVTIAATGVTVFTLNWTLSSLSTTLRDKLGFTGNLSGATTYTGTNQSRYLWLPNAGPVELSMPEPTATTQNFGAPETDLTFNTAPSGDSVRLYYNTIYSSIIRWQVLGSKTWITLETITNESFQKFYEDVIGKGVSFRYYADRSNDNLFWRLVVEDAQSFKPVPRDPGWFGANSLWNFGYLCRPLVNET